MIRLLLLCPVFLNSVALDPNYSVILDTQTSGTCAHTSSFLGGSSPIAIAIIVGCTVGAAAVVIVVGYFVTRKIRKNYREEFRRKFTSSNSTRTMVEATAAAEPKLMSFEVLAGTSSTSIV